jgi:hypothetical protein
VEEGKSKKNVIKERDRREGMKRKWKKKLQ